MPNLDIVTKVIIFLISGIINLGFKSLIINLTGRQAEQHEIDKKNIKNILLIIKQGL